LGEGEGWVSKNKDLTRRLEKDQRGVVDLDGTGGPERDTGIGRRGKMGDTFGWGEGVAI